MLRKETSLEVPKELSQSITFLVEKHVGRRQNKKITSKEYNRQEELDIFKKLVLSYIEKDLANGLKISLSSSSIKIDEDDKWINFSYIYHADRNQMFETAVKNGITNNSVDDIILLSHFISCSKY